MKARIIGVIALASTLCVMPLSAHHTARYLYDVDKPVSLKGTVTEVEWKNPHVIVHVDVKASDGAVVPWTLEARAAYLMPRRGLPRENFMKVGDAADMTVCIALDGSHQAEMRSFTAPDGIKIVGQC